jgi:hypothetical protein
MMVCTVQAAEPAQPKRNPLPIALPSGEFICPNVIVQWTQGKCEKSNDPAKFCVLVTLPGSNPAMRFKYIVMRVDGEPECQMTGFPEAVIPSPPVVDCDPTVLLLTDKTRDPFI